MPRTQRRQASYRHLANPTPTYFSCQWRSEKGKSLQNRIANRGVLLEGLPLAEAKQKCMEMPSCGGLTRQKDIANNLWTLREGSEAFVPLVDDARKYTDEELESLIILRGLCSCHCSKAAPAPPTCTWKPLYSKRLTYSVIRNLTCVADDSAPQVEGPRCGGPEGKSASFVQSWLQVPELVPYTRKQCLPAPTIGIALDKVMC